MNLLVFLPGYLSVLFMVLICVECVRCVWKWVTQEYSPDVFYGQERGWWVLTLVSQPSCLMCCLFFAPSTCSWLSQGLSPCWALLWCWASFWEATCALLCTWPPPTKPLMSGTEVTGPGASTAPTLQSPGSTGTSTPTGFGATFERSLYLLLHKMRERRNNNGKCYCLLNTDVWILTFWELAWFFHPVSAMCF